MEKHSLVEYVVKEKDTIAGIAIQNGMTVNQFKQLNKLTQPNPQIFPGQKFSVYYIEPKEELSKRKMSNTVQVPINNQQLSKSKASPAVSVSPRDNFPHHLHEPNRTENVSLGKPNKPERPMPFLVLMRNSLDRNYCNDKVTRSLEKKKENVDDALSLAAIRKLNLFQDTMSYSVHGCPVLGTLTIGGDRFVFEASLDSPEVAKYGLFSCQLAIFVSEILHAKFIFSNDTSHDSNFGLDYSIEITYTLTHHSPILKQEQVKLEVSDAPQRISKEESRDNSESDKDMDKVKVETKAAVFCASLETVYRLQKYLKRLKIPCANFDKQQKSLSMTDLHSEHHHPILENETDLLSENKENEENVELELQAQPLFEIPVLNQDSKILNDDLLKVLTLWLPERYQFSSTWFLSYGTAQHGISLNTFFRRMENCEGASLCIIKTTGGEIFGGFAAEQWVKRDDYYGNGETFLFSLSPNPARYNWTEKNSFFQYSSSDCIAFGGGVSGRFGLWIDREFETGNSTFCHTFDNSPLAKEEFFQIIHVEFWCFEEF